MMIDNMEVSIYKALTDEGEYCYYMVKRGVAPENVVDDYYDLVACEHLVDRMIPENGVVDYDQAVEDLHSYGYHRFTIFVGPRTSPEHDVVKSLRNYSKLSGDIYSVAADRMEELEECYEAYYKENASLRSALLDARERLAEAHEAMDTAKEFLRFSGQHQAYNILEDALKGDSDETSNR